VALERRTRIHTNASFTAYILVFVSKIDFEFRLQRALEMQQGGVFRLLPPLSIDEKYRSRSTLYKLIQARPDGTAAPEHLDWHAASATSRHNLRCAGHLALPNKARHLIAWPSHDEIAFIK
jgi:hypothetical protein